ncbi:Flavin-linked sulfhydryl oxidase of the mitochondrial IMS [Tilletia horrida]|uniref:Sulfhydryl oxidase n=1 Tax=Tilletia horrida TaxID=155126 RepID=A0AAN6JQE6_9BASI|nr:Flavin-linked sulfhydryl oxidase of the mitochondrial IMS [Tilletia horrida]
MPTFSSKPIGRKNGFLSRLSPRITRRPIIYFGIPFIFTITASSFLLAQFTQTRYDYNATKVQAVSKEEQLRMKKDRRRIDVREEYFRLSSSKSDDEWEDWDVVRVPRPEGTPEWGVAPGADSDLARPPPSSQKRGWFDWARPKPLHADAQPIQETQRRRQAERRMDTEDDSQGAVQQAATGTSRNEKPGGGIILGPDGKPCRACNSKLAFAAAMKGTTHPKVAPASSSEKTTAPTASTASSSSSSTSTDECPPDVEALGRATWTFLHSAAAYYPPNPSEAQQTAMRNLLRSLPTIYPCATCAHALGEEYAREQAEDRGWEGREGITLDQAIRGGGEPLSVWLCGVHNEVNARLGKPAFECTKTRLRQRWLDGPPDGRCD